MGECVKGLTKILEFKKKIGDKCMERIDRDV